MKKNILNITSIVAMILVSLSLVACGGGSGNSTNSSTSSGGNLGGTTGSSGSSGSGVTNNVVSITVSPGPYGNYLNGLFGSVTLCKPNTTTCTTVDNVIFDTGSVGVRIVSSALPAGFLSANTDGNGNTISNCTVFADGYTWGDVASATITLGGQTTASAIPVQVIGQSNYSVPSTCSSGNGNPEQTAQAIGANGIVGIGLFQEDCGAGCTTVANNGMYYKCSATSCVSSTVTLAQEIKNPVANLPANYNNGTVISLPAIDLNGTSNVPGNIYLGINTVSNNTFNNLTTINTSANGLINVTVNGVLYSESFLDSGSSIYALIDGSMPQCTGNYSGLFCPTSSTNLPITISTTASTQTNSSSINIGNAQTLLSSTTNNAYNDLASVLNAPLNNAVDLGLTFFYGKNVATGIESTSSNIGTGSYFAF